MNQRDWADKDYYRDLGVSSSASAADIKRAYRKLARENHPDNHPGDAAAEERFKRAAEAYDVVGDEHKRKEYDQLKALLSSGGFGGKGRSGFPGGFRKEAGEFHFDDLFGSGAEGFGGDGGLGDIFGSFINRGSASRRPSRASRGADISTEVTLDFREAVEGTTLPLSISGTFTCDHCHGTGSATGARSTCSDCHGTGFTSEERGAFGFSRPCTTCNGTGEKITNPCTYCHGTGSTTAAKKISIKIPPGAEEGQKLRVKRKGQAGPPGTPPGDLLVGIRVREDPVFTRSGRNLEVEIPVSFAELALGGEIVVPTLTDPVRLKVPAGTGNGRKLRLKGRGVPEHGTKPAGDLLVTVTIKVPTHLDETARTALRTYAQAERDSGFSPRP